jgi:hypothetical protein
MIWPAIALLAAAAAEPTCQTADRRVESVIASKAKELAGYEYCQSRLYHTIDDIDGDDKDDFILVFAIEAADGDDSTQYLAVFASRRNWKPVLLKVGRSGERLVDAVDVEEGRIIVLMTSEYEEGDPICCPSGEGELRYRFVQGRIIPVPGASPNDKVLTKATRAPGHGPRGGP